MLSLVRNFTLDPSDGGVVAVALAEGGVDPVTSACSFFFFLAGATIVLEF